MEANKQDDAPRVRAKVIAAHYDVTEDCVRKWAAAGKIPCIRIEGTVRFDLAAVIESIEGKPAR